MSEPRKVILLKACLEMLKKAEASHSVINVMASTVHYDEADCDGYCLMQDIEDELGEQP